MADPGSAKRFRANLQGEVDGARLYRALSDAESDPELNEVYSRLAAVEEAHAEFWRGQLAKIGAKVGALRAGLADARVGLARAPFRPAIRAADALDAGTARRSAVRRPARGGRGWPAGGRTLACRVVAGAGAAFPAGATGGMLAQIEGRHRAGGNALRAAVLGANDGLVSNFSLVMGVAGRRDRRQDDPPDRARRAYRRRLLDGDGRVAVGHQLARAEPSARSRSRPTSSRIRPRRKRKSWC